jgi:hypothetical protein
MERAEATPATYQANVSRYCVLKLADFPLTIRLAAVDVNKDVLRVGVVTCSLGLAHSLGSERKLLLAEIMNLMRLRSKPLANFPSSKQTLFET